MTPFQSRFEKWRSLFLAAPGCPGRVHINGRAARARPRGQPNVAAFEHRLEENLCQLQAELVTHSYRPGAYHSFYIHEPKRRLISAAPFRDRVVHHALCNLIEPMSEAYDMVYFPGDDLLAALRPRGLPIGNLTSQFWANVYLNPVDHFVKRELGCRGYLRFVDDFLLFANDKAELWQWKQALERRLASFRLTMHPAAHPKPVTEGISFLGFIVFPEYRRLKRRKGVHFSRRFRRLLAAYRDGQISLERLTASVQGWVNHARYGNTTGLRRAVLTRQVIPRVVRPGSGYRQMGISGGHDGL